MPDKESNEERVRRNTRDRINHEIDAQTLANIRKYGVSEASISTRIKELEKEWSIERALELNMPIVSVISLALAVFISPYWLILTAIVLLFFMQHAIQGWCPPLPIFRRLKYRTRSEIDVEKFALKALRGDFSNTDSTPEKAFANAKSL